MSYFYVVIYTYLIPLKKVSYSVGSMHLSQQHTNCQCFQILSSLKGCPSHGGLYRDGHKFPPGKNYQIPLNVCISTQFFLDRNTDMDPVHNGVRHFFNKTSPSFYWMKTSFRRHIVQYFGKSQMLKHNFILKISLKNASVFIARSMSKKISPLSTCLLISRGCTYINSNDTNLPLSTYKISYRMDLNA